MPGRSVVGGPRGGPTWDRPKYDWGRPKPDQPLTAGPSTTGDVPWEDAPTTSHIARFRFSDASESSFLRRFGEESGASQLSVVFKDEKSGGDGPEYVYFFADATAGRALLEKLRGSPHPYGEVLYPLVIQAGVPYRRVSR